MTETMKEAILRDKKENPSCRYSTETVTSCRSVDGERKCETTLRVWRSCNKHRPVEVYSKTESSEGTGDVESQWSKFFPRHPQGFERNASSVFSEPQPSGPHRSMFGEGDGDALRGMFRPFKDFFEEQFQWPNILKGEMDSLHRGLQQRPVQTTPNYLPPHRFPKGVCPEQTESEQTCNVEQA